MRGITAVLLAGAALVLPARSGAVHVPVIPGTDGLAVDSVRRNENTLESVARLLAKTEGPDPAVRRAAEQELVRVSIRALEGSSEVRKAVIPNIRPGQAEQLLEPLIACLSDGDESVQRLAQEAIIRALPRMKSYGALKRLSTVRSMAIKNRALSYLVRLRDPRVVPLLIAGVSPSNPRATRMTSVIGLATLRDPRGILPLAELLEISDCDAPDEQSLKRVAKRALETMGGAAILGELESARSRGDETRVASLARALLVVDEPALTRWNRREWKKLTVFATAYEARIDGNSAALLLTALVVLMFIKLTTRLRVRSRGCG
ncbi:HEAT repeat domain-containing protein [Elusimicrobiota bacterium]